MRSGKDKEYPKLTVKRADFLRAYKKRAEEKGKPPSCIEMADIAGSNQYAAVIVHTLRRKGYLPPAAPTQDGEHSDLTNQRADALRKWNAFRDGSGRDPTIKEMSHLLGKSATAVVNHLFHLREAGHLPPSKAQVHDAEFPDIGERTANILRAFKRAAAKCGGAPTVREILAETDLGWRSTNAVVEAANRLVIAGYLIRGPENKSRSLRLTDKAFPERKMQQVASSLPPEVRHFANAIGITLDSSPEVGLHASVGDVELTVNTHTGTVVLRRKDDTRLALKLPPGDPIHRKAAFADLLWILQGAAAK